MNQTDNLAICPRMWKGISDRDGESVYPCCRFDYFDEPGVRIGDFDSIEEAYNSPFFLKMRKQMLNGETPNQCRRCLAEESAGIKSERLHAKESDPGFDPESCQAPLRFVNYIELFTGNRCNLRCHSCNPTSSSSWASEYHQLGWQWPERVQKTELSESIQSFASLEEIKVIGGEPLLSPLFYDVIQNVKDKENVEIHISTNATKFLSSEHVDQLKKFKKVWISISIDGPGEVNDLLRYPSKWTQVESVAIKYIALAQERSNFRISLHVTLYLLNLTKLSSLLDWWDLVTKDKKNCKYKISLLQSPEFMAIQNITPEGLQNILPELRRDERLLAVVRLLEAQAPGQKDTLPDLFDYCQKLDQKRNVDTSSLIKYLIR